MKEKLSGTGVALATPMNQDLSIDFPALGNLVSQSISDGVNYLVVLGTTGESPVLSWKEKLDVLSFVIEKNEGRLPIIFGHGGNNTKILVDRSKELASYEIDGLLSVSPFYSRPSQEGITRHFTMLADAFPKPIILYNVPSRTASNMTAETTLQLALHENIVAMKEASGDLAQSKQIIDHKPDDFVLLSGEDQLTLQMIRDGADGVISVIANLLPKPFTQMVAAALSGDFLHAEKLHKSLEKAYQLLSKEGNPSSLKAGMSVRGLCEDFVRPPLFEGSAELRTEWETLFSKI